MGGTQFNGRALVHELARAGHDVTVCNRADATRFDWSFEDALLQELG